MKPTQLLHNLGQSLWLDNITRDLLNSGTLKGYVEDLSVTGLTSNLIFFDHAIKNSPSYDAVIREILAKGKTGEGLFFELALELILPAPPTCSGRFTIAQTEWTDGCRWKCRHSWPMTRPAPSPRPRNFPGRRDAPICSSRSPAQRKVRPP